MAKRCSSQGLSRQLIRASAVPTQEETANQRKGNKQACSPGTAQPLLPGRASGLLPMLAAAFRSKAPSVFSSGTDTGEGEGHSAVVLLAACSSWKPGHRCDPRLAAPRARTGLFIPSVPLKSVLPCMAMDLPGRCLTHAGADSPSSEKSLYVALLSTFCVALSFPV